jgi:hypothetical protein
MDQDIPELFVDEIPAASLCTEQGLRRTVEKAKTKEENDEHEPPGWLSECEEGDFSEVRIAPILGSSHSPALMLQVPSERSVWFEVARRLC